MKIQRDSVSRRWEFSNSKCARPPSQSESGMGSTRTRFNRKCMNAPLIGVGRKRRRLMIKRVNCGRIHYLKASACLLLAFILVGCKSRPAVKENKEASNGPTQRKMPSPTSAAPEEATEGVKSVSYRNTGGGVRYVGSKACAPCHLKIYNEYLRTPHAQAASLPSQRPELHDVGWEERRPAHGESAGIRYRFSSGTEHKLWNQHIEPHRRYSGKRRSSPLRWPLRVRLRGAKAFFVALDHCWLPYSL